jgi:predicted  nucleic acid-binding Zn-ribbon protein
MDKIIVEYQLKTEELRKELGDVKKQLSDTEKQVETSGSKMSNVFKKRWWCYCSSIYSKGDCQVRSRG